jgi:hypothetical protein
MALALRTNMQNELGNLPFLDLGIYAKRDSLPSIAYSEELISATNSATLQSTDRHYGIVVQKRPYLQLDL